MQEIAARSSNLKVKVVRSTKRRRYITFGGCPQKTLCEFMWCVDVRQCTSSSICTQIKTC